MQGAGWKAAVMAAVLSFFLTTVAAHDVTFPTVAPPFFLEAASGRLTTAAAPAAAARGSRVIFFNEFHDSEDCHAAEYDILQALYAQYGDRLVLSMEMFERDVQPAVDAFCMERRMRPNFCRQRALGRIMIGITARSFDLPRCIGCRCWQPIFRGV